MVDKRTIMFKEKLYDVFAKNGFILSDFQQTQFENYYNLLKEWNEKMNLTAIIDEDGVLYKHFLDSVMGSKFIPQKATVIDVGVGAGFPSIPLKILRPDLKFTLVDSLNKRLIFLEEVKSTLKLEDVEIVHARCEDLATKVEYREKYDIAVARAVAKMNTLSEYLLPFVKIGGYMVAYKGADIQNELKEADKAIVTLGGKFTEIHTYQLDDFADNHNVVVIKKVCATPKKYPRNGNKPKTSPIC